jgi:nitrite reductase (NADH) large subunit
MDYVKKKILDDAEGRKALWERLQFALDGEPDPWFEFDKAAVDTRAVRACDRRSPCRTCVSNEPR